MRQIVTFFFWLLLLGGAFAAYDAHRFLTTPGSDTPEEIVITIAQGATFDRVAWDLKKAGAITDVTRFRLLGRFQDALGRVRAGEYQINTGWTPGEVLRQITQGQALLYRLLIREGLTWWETAREVEAQGFARYEDFKEVIHDPAFLQSHNIPFANAEGFLYPDTYLRRKPRVLDKTEAREVAASLVMMFWNKTRPLWTALPRKNAEPPGTRGSVTAPAAGSAEVVLPQESPAPPEPADMDPESLRRLVILASLVEKETAVPAERARVAGVYANRLRLDMLLQCDPTIIYGIGEKFSGSIRKSQLADARNPYNTYVHAGLPPGPICSPGLEAVRAAVEPERHDFLYFVATGIDGGHTFSKTLEAHNRATQVYRSRMREGQ